MLGTYENLVLAQSASIVASKIREATERNRLMAAANLYYAIWLVQVFITQDHRADEIYRLYVACNETCEPTLEARVERPYDMLIAQNFKKTCPYALILIPWGKVARMAKKLFRRNSNAIGAHDPDYNSLLVKRTMLLDIRTSAEDYIASISRDSLAQAAAILGTLLFFNQDALRAMLKELTAVIGWRQILWAPIQNPRLSLEALKFAMKLALL